MVFHLSEIEKKIEYSFKNPEILRVAFTHASYSNEKRGEKNNERLEFLGDSVLGFVVTDYLFRGTNEDEGDMTMLKQAVVSFKPLSLACDKLKLASYLLVGEKVQITEKLKENLMESVIGAIYLDGGYEPVKKFILKRMSDRDTTNYKGELQELLQSKGESLPVYETVKYGMDNAPTYEATATALGVVGKGEGRSKKSAEQLAAKDLLDKLS